MMQPTHFNQSSVKFNSFHNEKISTGKQIKQRHTKPNQTIAVLVVEDDPISQRVAQLTLENKGYRVDIAATGEKALALHQVNSYSLILMDLGLPDMSGIEATNQIRKLEQMTGKHTIIISLTAHGESVKQHCLQAGMDDFITKPVPLEQLNQLIQGWLAK